MAYSAKGLTPQQVADLTPRAKIGGVGAQYSAYAPPAAVTPAPMPFFNDAKAKAAAAPGIPTPAKPAPPPIVAPREMGGDVPELAKLGGDYGKYLQNLESGSGYASDVLAGAQKDTLEAQVAEARQAAAEQGIPFDESKTRAQLMQGVNKAMATEKLGREQLLGQAYANAPGIVGANEAAKLARWRTGQAGDIATTQAKLAEFGTEAGEYGSELSAATSSNNALLGFLSNLYNGMFSAMRGPDMTSYYG